MVIIASTRPGRAGLPIGTWFARLARAQGQFDVSVTDLAELGLPMFDEPRHPRLRQYQHAHTVEWSTLVEEADAFVIVTPEYNYGYPAPLKNAIDFLHAEWAYKPIGFVSYGGIAAGTRAVQQLKQVVTTLRMMPIFESVGIPFHTRYIDTQGVLAPTDSMLTAASAMLDELFRTEKAIRGLRRAPSDARESR